MSTNKTQNYQLHAWALGDEPPMSEFNENFTKLDAALKAEETARSTGLAGKVGVVTGSYTGNGSYPRVITLGFQPKAVVLSTDYGRMGDSSNRIFGGLILPGNKLVGRSGSSVIGVAELTSTGFRLIQCDYAECGPNHSSHVFYYLAIR